MLSTTDSTRFKENGTMKRITGLFAAVIICFSASAVTKIACVGASITEGAFIEDKAHFSFPGQLQTLLGSAYDVKNYGVGGCTMLKKGDSPYWNTPQYNNALNSNPDIVFIDLGGNDAKLVNRLHLNEINGDCQAMIEAFGQLPSHPRVIVMLPVVSFVKDTAGIWEEIIVKRIIPQLRQATFEKNAEVLDMHPLLINHEELIPDKIHPDKEGSSIIAMRLYEAVVQPRDEKFDIFPELAQTATINSFAGYKCASFAFKGRECKVVQPKWSATGHPWIWRARFWAHEPQTDIALLERGFHFVYIDVAELFGNDESISLYNSFYTLLKKAGLSSEALMEGMSRGAVYVLNWAAVNPGKVCGVYIDNPLLDMKSWPCGLGKREPSPAELEAFKQDYNINSDTQLSTFKNSPVDKVHLIAKGNYPILILCADEDKAALPEENTLPFEQKMKEAGKQITVIHKPGFGHHPHSFPNPEPIVRFLLNASGYNFLPRNN